MATYSKIIPITLQLEGVDTVTDIKGDRGGTTKYGISLKFAQDATKLKSLLDRDKDGDVDAADIKLLDLDTALEVYKVAFWDILRLDELESNKVALVVFDTCVNSGKGNAVGIAQKTLKDLGIDIIVDKQFGNATFGALNNVDETSFCTMFLDKRANFFRKIVENDPTQGKFLKGWLNRVAILRNKLGNL